MPTPEQIHNQYLLNLNKYYDAVQVLDEIARNETQSWRRQEAEKEVKFRKSMMDGFAKQWSSMTGRSLYVMLPPGLDSGEDEIDKAERQKQELTESQKNQALKEQIRQVRNDLKTLQDACERMVENRLRSFFASQFVDLFVAGGPLVPVDINKRTTANVESALASAQAFLQKGQLTLCRDEIQRAANNLERGVALFNEWVADRENGAGRPEAAIKTTHSVVTSTLCSLAPGRFGNAACSAMSEFSLQGSLLALKQLSGKERVSLDDLAAAAKEVAIAGGSAQLGNELGPLLAKGLSQQLANTILNKPASKEAVEFVSKRISAYVAIWSSEVSKKMVGLKKDDFDGWLMIVAPAIDPAAVELMKEKELHNSWHDMSFK